MNSASPHPSLTVCVCLCLQFGSSPVMVEEAWEGSYAEEPESMTPEEADQLLSAR